MRYAEKTMVRWVLAAAAAFSLSGCYTTTFRVDDLNPGSLPDGQVVKTFHSETWTHHFLFGILTLNEPDVKETVAREVQQAGGAYARNVRLTHQRTFLQGLIAGFVWYLYAPTTVYVDGEAVR